MADWSNVSNARVVVSPKTVASGLLLRVGISGVAVAVWGAAMLVSATTSATTAIVALLAGIAVATLSLRKAWSMLQADGDGDVPVERKVERNRPHVGTTVAGALR